jgi:4-amino-4-deoxy-L-arabinose transferase-like glycosyltransferase
MSALARLGRVVVAERVLVGALALGLAFHVAIIASWHAPGGDGVQYHALSEELKAHGRFAFAPPPAPLSYTRLPGYPLFLAYLVRGGPLPLARHVVRAVRANLLVDLGTALALFFVVADRLGRRAARIAAGLVWFCPLLFILSAYALSEPLATFLATLELALALAAARGRTLALAALTGVVAGLAQLVRADAVTSAPAVALALVWVPRPWRVRVGALAACALAAALVFAPWPLRNLARFGASHPAAAAWRAVDGTPLGEGVFDWSRTWSWSAPGQSFFEVMIVWKRPLQIERPGVIVPAMYDDEREHQRVVALFRRYNAELMSPAVDAEFEALARERRARFPFRTFVTLPLGRIARLWPSVPEAELPIRVPWLGLPTARPALLAVDCALYALALVGALGLWRRGAGSLERRTLAVLGVALVTRVALYGFAIPASTNQRYLAEVFPLLLALAACALARLDFARLMRR